MSQFSENEWDGFYHKIHTWPTLNVVFLNIRIAINFILGFAESIEQNLAAMEMETNSRNIFWWSGATSGGLVVKPGKRYEIEVGTLPGRAFDLKKNHV